MHGCAPWCNLQALADWGLHVALNTILRGCFRICEALWQDNCTAMLTCTGTTMGEMRIPERRPMSCWSQTLLQESYGIFSVTEIWWKRLKRRLEIWRKRRLAPEGCVFIFDIPMAPRILPDQKSHLKMEVYSWGNYQWWIQPGKIIHQWWIKTIGKSFFTADCSYCVEF